MAPLDGLRVLDLTMWRPGPYATQLLAQLGADVIKVEPPGGEPMRMFRDHFDVLNRHKRGIVLDLKSEEGLARLKELAGDAEVFVEGSVPASPSGWAWATRGSVPSTRGSSTAPSPATARRAPRGRPRPRHQLPRLRRRAAPDAVSPEADELPVADMSAATMAAFAITAACLKARETGTGDRVDLGMADVLAHWVGTVPAATRRSGAGPVPGYGVYPTKDGHRITLGVVSEERLWDATCRALGIGEHAASRSPSGSAGSASWTGRSPRRSRGSPGRRRSTASPRPAPRSRRCSRMPR